MKFTKALVAALIITLSFVSYSNEALANDSHDVALSIAEGILGVPFEVDSNQHVFEFPGGGRVITWQFLDLLGHTLNPGEFAFSGVGNVFNTELGDVFIVSMDDELFLYIDIGSGLEVSLSEEFRQYSSFRLEILEYDFAADALYFVETIEAVHPIFLFPDMLAEDYEDVRNEFLERAASINDTTEFAFAMQQYVRVLQDGHMSFASRQLFGNLFANVDWTFENGRLFLINDGNERAEVVKIGGVTVPEILEVIERYFFFENEFDRQFNTAIMTRNRGIHQRAGADLSDGYITITVDTNGELTDVVIEYQSGWLPADFTQPRYVIRYEELDDDIFFISLRSFRFSEPYHQQTIEAIENAIESGTRHFILDLRDNSGGNSQVGAELLQAMGISLPNFGTYRRLSTRAWDQRVEFLPEDRIEFMVDLLEDNYGELFPESLPSIESASNRYGVTVAVLTNNITYSSATMTATWIQDGGLGVVIGEPSTNAPSAFGDSIFFVLPHSRMQLSVSYSRFVRPDTQADQTTLWPDIPVDQSLAMEAALEFFADK